MSFSMEDLGRIVVNPDASSEEKLLALSCAKEIGKAEALQENSRAVKSELEALPW